MAAEKLFVHVDLGDGEKVLAGQLLVDDKQGRFKYARVFAIRAAIMSRSNSANEARM